MNRQDILRKVAELLSNPGTCKLGLLMARQEDFAVTAREMCLVILDTTLLSHQKMVLAEYLLDVDKFLFHHDTYPDDTSKVKREWVEERLVEARWKKWGSKGNPNYQRKVLKTIGLL